MLMIISERSRCVPLGCDLSLLIICRLMRSRLFLLVVLTVKVLPWELCRVQDEGGLWDAPKNTLYIFRVLRERLFVNSVGVQ